MSHHPIEALLRPPVEFSSVLSYCSLAVIAIGAPQLFLLPGGVGYVLGGAFRSSRGKTGMAGHSTGLSTSGDCGCCLCTLRTRTRFRAAR